MSLLDDEIDERLEQFVAHGKGAGDFSHAALELTDAVVICDAGNEIIVMRGACCTFPLYWCRLADRLHLSTTLPLPGARFSRPAFMVAVAVGSLPGSHEPNACTETPLADWKRLRRGAVSTFTSPACVLQERQIESAAPESADLSRETVAAQVHDAFRAYGHSQRHVTSSVVELSGGYDSTLAAAAALRPTHAMQGISVEFPYYEFRFEGTVQRTVADALGIARTVLQGTELFPYAPWQRAPRFDEPALFVTGIRHAERVAEFAAARQASRIYSGHGGDHLFAMDLLGAESVAADFSRKAFSPSAWASLERALHRIREPTWRLRRTGCFAYDARQDVWIKETFGLTLRTPFTDRKVFAAGLAWSQWNARQGTKPDKTVLELAVGHLLPEAVTRRHGKVAYDGVWMRAYAAHHDHIAQCFEKTSALLEHIGLVPAWLLQRVRAMADWEPVSGREVLAAYGIACWWLSRDITRIQDLEWE